ncbi:retron system putative HNH endonuclease [Kaistella yonginensis]|uniref:retron system putative HNH endonuclease n=1 Tax=Kaistella yonginensis TaxID=658267 RepID=UPI0025B4D076|nr:retron system putative HNH endonuclease [Kaistella yonginensis]MDN3605851.1 retron system putative HNH endonuclease [Kaistella yonginensis]
MKRIIKRDEPASYIQIKLKNEKAGVKMRYDKSLGAAERIPIKNALLKEQGFICAYTLKRIELDSCHIEHLKPEELCRKHLEEGIETVSDLDYSNMVACYPKDAPKGVAKQKYFGAIKKDDYWSNDGKDYILPLHPNCENHFTYNKKGEVTGNTANGKNTIELLALDHKQLVYDRKRTIDNFIGVKDPIKKAKTIQALSEIDKLQNGKFVEYCIPIKHALKEHLNFLQRLEKKMKYMKKS